MYILKRLREILNSREVDRNKVSYCYIFPLCCKEVIKHSRRASYSLFVPVLLELQFAGGFMSKYFMEQW